MTDLASIRQVLRDDQWSDEVEALMSTQIMGLSAELEIPVDAAVDFAYELAASGLGGMEIVAGIRATRSWIRALGKKLR